MKSTVFRALLSKNTELLNKQNKQRNRRKTRKRNKMTTCLLSFYFVLLSCSWKYVDEERSEFYFLSLALNTFMLEHYVNIYTIRTNSFKENTYNYPAPTQINSNTVGSTYVDIKKKKKNTERNEEDKNRAKITKIRL